MDLDRLVLFRNGPSLDTAMKFSTLSLVAIVGFARVATGIQNLRWTNFQPAIGQNETLSFIVEFDQEHGARSNATARALTSFSTNA